MLHRLLLAMALALLPHIALAEAAPFGLPVGSATLQDVKQTLGPKTKLENAGLNKWSHGPMLKSNGAGLGIESLQSAYFIFSPQEKLIGVLLTLPKERYASVKNSLRSKYKLISAQEPFVGNQLARFRDGEITIEASAPHMSFEMELTYTHAELRALRDRMSQAEAAQKQKIERSNL